MLDRNLVIVYLTILLANVIYGLVAPFLPQFLEEREILSSWTGLIIAVYSISMVIFSPIAGAIVDSVGHSKLMGFGGFLMACSIAAFSTEIYIDSNWFIIFIAIVLRASQGK